jgi:hypothetical protein
VYHGQINDALNPGDEPSKHTLSGVLDAVVEGTSIVEWFVPSQGCSIKWK